MLIEIPTSQEYFPEGTKLFLKHETYSIFVIEQKPTVRTLKFNTKYYNYNNENENENENEIENEIETKPYVHGSRPSGIKAYRLPLPYCIFIVQKYPNFIGLYFSNKPLRNLKTDLLYMAPLPNISPEGLIRLGNESYFNTQKTIDSVWSSIFSMYLNSVGAKGLETFEKWQKLSSLDILGIDWPRGRNIKDILNENFTEIPE